LIKNDAAIMTLPEDTVVIGLTGSFGSGCSTAAQLIAARPALLGGESPSTPTIAVLRLSTFLREEAARRGENVETRGDLQTLGDSIRKEQGTQALAAMAVDHLRVSVETTNTTTSDQRSSFLLIDGLRNLGEIRYLRARFPSRFWLFAIDAPAQVRWTRLRAEYEKRGHGEREFLRDDSRDQNEETPYGQQVELCVDEADVIILNDSDLTDVQRINLAERVAEFILLVAGVKPRYPTESETIMNLAYSASHATRCLKRQVGAVVVSTVGEPISLGFNENPSGTKPCVDEYGQCYRDIVRNQHFTALAETEARCPNCGTAMPRLVGPPWRCSCGANLEKTFFPDRAMNWCTALHAEERALLNAAGRDVRGATVYTTTFPCFLCAEKLAHAGIRRVVYMEPYPDIQAAARLEIANIEVERFEGVRSSRFFSIFSPVRQLEEERIAASRASLLL
jgi:deoxycytidylate deaminase